MCQCSLNSIFLTVSMFSQQFIPECVNAPSTVYSGMCQCSFNRIFWNVSTLLQQHIPDYNFIYKKNLSSAAIGSSSDDRKTFLRSTVGYTGYNNTCLLDLYSVSCGPFTVNSSQIWEYIFCCSVFQVPVRGYGKHLNYE